MIGIRVKKKGAEATRAYLKAHKLMDKQHNVFGRKEFIYFPILAANDAEVKALKKLGAERADTSFKMSAHHSEDYRGLLLKELGKERYDNVTKSYDLIGDTAVIDARGPAAMKIAKAIRKVNRNLMRIVSKSGAVSGAYRTRNFRHVWGKKGYEVSYRENGITITTDLRKAFFSTRLAYERKRISDASRDKENVVVMFAGVGPFAILIAKEHPRSKVVAIELNKEGYKYLVRNIEINKTGNVAPVLGDVNLFGKKYKGFADRIVMPLPKDSYDFLGAANEMAGKKCTIHFYAFGRAVDPYTWHLSRIKKFFRGKGRKVKFLGKRIVRTYSHKEVEVAVDFILQ